MADSDEVALGSQHAHQVALFRLMIEMVDGAREYPRMKATQRFVLTAFKNEVRHFESL